jgi:hypothetical protein
MADAHALIDDCEEPELAHLLQRLELLRADGAAGPGVDDVLSALGDDPVRHLVVPLLELAMTAESPRALFDGACAYLERTQAERAIQEQTRRMVEAADASQEQQELTELHAALRRSKVEKSPR